MPEPASNETGTIHSGLRIAPMTPQLTRDVVAIRIGAFANQLDDVLGPRLTTSYVEWFAAQDNGIALVAFANDQPAGYVFGLPSSELPTLRWAGTSHVITCLVRRPRALLTRALWSRIRLYFRRMMTGGISNSIKADLPNPSYCLLSLAVSNRERRNGLGLALIDAFERECAERGAKSMQLATTKENMAARLLYERRGWRASELAEDPYLCYYKQLQADATARRC